MESEDKRMAWFPAPYLEKLDEDEDEDDTDGISDRGTGIHRFFRSTLLHQPRHYGFMC